jgi:hypothetical protein
VKEHLGIGVFVVAVNASSDDADNYVWAGGREAPSLRGLSPMQMQEAILQAVDAFVRGASQADDLTLLIVRYMGRS